VVTLVSGWIWTKGKFRLVSDATDGGGRQRWLGQKLLYLLS